MKTETSSWFLSFLLGSIFSVLPARFCPDSCLSTSCPEVSILLKWGSILGISGCEFICACFVHRAWLKKTQQNLAASVDLNLEYNLLVLIVSLAFHIILQENVVIVDHNKYCCSKPNWFKRLPGSPKHFKEEHVVPSDLFLL